MFVLGIFIPCNGFADSPITVETLTKEQRDRIEIPARTKRGETPTGRAQFGIETFEAGCFLKFWDRHQLLEWANKYFTATSENDEMVKTYFKLLHVQKGKMWDAHFPEGVVAIILEDNGTCHTVLHGVSENAFHEEMKKFADKAVSNLKEKSVTYNYETVQADSGPHHFQSTIKIVQPENDNTVEILATTLERGGRYSPNGFITIKY